MNEELLTPAERQQEEKRLERAFQDIIADHGDADRPALFAAECVASAERIAGIIARRLKEASNG